MFDFDLLELVMPVIDDGSDAGGANKENIPPEEGRVSHDGVLMPVALINWECY